MKNFISRYWPLLIIIAVKFILQYTLVNPFYELHRDEFLHLDQADHPAFGYISVPPLTSLVSKMIFLFGGGEFWVKFFPALFGALTIVAAWFIVEDLGGKMWSKLLVSLALLFSVLVRINLLFQPNSFDILAWTLMYRFIIRYVKDGNSRDLLWLAVVTALGVLNKYNVVFLVSGLAAGLALTSARRIFTGRALWKAAALCIILILPNIIWQVIHDFPVINHMRVLKENQLDNNSVAVFLSGQVRIFFGSIPLTIAGIGALLFYKPFRPYRFVGLSFLFVIGLFALLKAKDYYSLGLYPVIFAFSGIYLENVLRSKVKSVLISTLIFLNAAGFAVMVPYVMPVMSPQQIRKNSGVFEKSGMLRWEDGKNHNLPQDFADMTGWKEMAAKALEAYRMIPADEVENTLVFCDNYGQTGALNYYNRGKMKEAYSFNTDYIYWLPHITYIKNVILVGEMTEDRIASMFREYKIVGTVENEYAREKGTGIFLLTGAEPGFTKFFYDEAERRKRELDIF